MDGFLFLLIIIGIGFFSGTFVERNHYSSIIRRERQFLNLPAVTMKTISDDESEIQKSELVYGCAVVAEDSFKAFVAGLRNFFGGRIRSYETLVDRARREAILRMKEMAPQADIILNLKIETSMLNDGAEEENNSNSTVAVVAYGTAITYRK